MAPLREQGGASGHAWDRLQDERIARFPFPPHWRIPNFAGAEAARGCSRFPSIGTRAASR